MLNKLIVQFPTGERKTFSTANQSLNVGDMVLVDIGSVVEVAKVVTLAKSKNSHIPQRSKAKETKDNEKNSVKFLRQVSQKDLERISKLKQKTKYLLAKADELIIKHKLSMKLIDAQLSFDEKKITIYFSAEGRVDFRELVLDLTRAFRKLVRLQQIGTRDEAKIFGGFGKCGRELCCSKFLNNMESINLDMAKSQDLNSGIGKISGLCGKLMCCLSYEIQEYQKLLKKMPDINSIITTPQGKGKVISRYALAQKVLVEVGDGQRVEVKL